MDLSETCRVLYQINLRKSASRWLSASIPNACIKCCDTPHDGHSTCPKHVEYFTKWIWEIDHLVGFHYKNVNEQFFFYFHNVTFYFRRHTNRYKMTTFLIVNKFYLKFLCCGGARQKIAIARCYKKIFNVAATWRVWDTRQSQLRRCRLSIEIGCRKFEHVI